MFQTLAHTAELGPIEVKLLSNAHRSRNLTEYEGFFDVEAATIHGLRKIGEKLEKLLD